MKMLAERYKQWVPEKNSKSSWVYIKIFNGPSHLNATIFMF